MHRISKKTSSRCGFTLVEMITVVAIIVIIAAVVGVGIADLIRAAHDSEDAVNASSEALKKQINKNEDDLYDYGFGVDDDDE